MSGTFPDYPSAEEIVLDSNQPVVESLSSSGKRQSRIVEGHMWQMKLKYPIMERKDFAPIYGFSMAQMNSSFQIVLPQFKVPQGVGTGSPIAATTAAGSTSVTTSGWTPSIIGILKAGDILKFSNHTKVYMQTEDVDSSAVVGGAILNIRPPLVEPLAGAEIITVNDVPFTMFFSKKIISWKTQKPEISSYTIDLTESIQ